MLFQGQSITAVPTARSSGNPNVQQLPLGELAISEVLPRYAAPLLPLAWSALVLAGDALGAERPLDARHAGRVGLGVGLLAAPLALTDLRLSQAVSALLNLGAGLLAHYDAILVVPAAAYLQISNIKSQIRVKNMSKILLIIATAKRIQWHLIIPIKSNYAQ